MWNDKRIKKAIISNILASILFLLVLFLVDNRTYLFTYLPHRFTYEPREAYIQRSNLRHDYARVVVMEQGEVVATDTVKHAFGETKGSVITVGYAMERKPSIVRITPVVTYGQLGVLLALILGNLGFVWRIHKAGG